MMQEPPPSPGEYRLPLPVAGGAEAVPGGIEAIDRLILELLSQRFALLRDAARNGAAIDYDDEDHRRAAISGARRLAFELGVPVGLVGDFWDRLHDATAASIRQAMREV
ncbi:MAG: hypothetical protein B7Z36_02145 [Novosphingobium sp. 12-63-9]|nr:MAG: hypothetical protein B7Z36_02145 [Novosphingobium sp. 12-63-9]